jgi:hypothetical protein
MLGCATFIIVGISKQPYNKVILPIEKAMGIVLSCYIYIYFKDSGGMF